MRHPLLPLLLMAVSLWARHPFTTAFDVYPVDYQRIAPLASVPADTLDSLVLTAALGEYECASFVVRARQPLVSLEIRLTPFQCSATGRILPADSIELRYAEYDWTDTLHTRALPLRLRPNAALSLASGGNRPFWLTFRADHPSDTGRFTGFAVVRANGLSCSLTVVFSVRPYRLLEFDGFTCGAFVGSISSINRAAARDIKAHGIDAVQFFLGKGGPFPGIYNSDTFPLLLNQGGHLKVQLRAADSMLTFLKEAGCKGPITFSTGNDSKGHLERDICDAFTQFTLDTTPNLDNKTRIIGPTDDPVFDTLMVSAVRQWKERIESRGFEMVLLIYDEPTERMMAPLADRYALYKAAFPDLRCYGVAMNQLSYARQIEPYSEILVANGSFLSIYNFARTEGRDYWFYGGLPSSEAPGTCRGEYGLRFWKYNPSAVYFWALNYYSSDPYVNTDAGGAESDKAVLFPPCSATAWRPVGSPAWEGLREARDDWAYVKTLERLITVASGSAASAARAALPGLRTRITDYAFSSGTPNYRPLDSIRTVCADWILGIQREDPGVWSRIKAERTPQTLGLAAPFGVFPNPFTPRARLRISGIEGLTTSDLAIHDMAGRRIFVRQGFRGTALSWDTADLPQGLYTVRLKTGNRTLTCKLVLVR